LPTVCGAKTLETPSVTSICGLTMPEGKHIAGGRALASAACANAHAGVRVREHANKIGARPA